MKLKAKLKSKRRDILDIAANFGATRIRIFGSVARGEERPDSDVDFLVDMEPNRTLFDLGGFVVELEKLLGCKIDVVTEKGLNPLLKEEVLKEAVNL